MSNKRGKFPAHAVAPAPKQTFGTTQTNPFRIPFRTPTQEDIFLYQAQIEENPSILAEDADSYLDKKYAIQVSRLYWTMTKGIDIPIFQRKKFNIGDMEDIFAKLEAEHFDAYRDLCNFWGLSPKKHKYTKPIKIASPANYLQYMLHWGYFDLYFSNFPSIIDMVASKTYTKTKMSKADMAKYAMIFALFITGQSFMPYDAENIASFEEKQKSAGNKVSKADIESTVFSVVLPREKGDFWNASTLHFFYKKYMRELPDGAINIDAIEYFLDLLDYEHKLIIKEFADLLSEDERSDFLYMQLKPIANNSDVRALKEKIFPVGPWSSANALFMTYVSKKEQTAFRYAYNRFSKNDFKFGENVETVKEPYTAKHVLSHKEYLMPGYLYAWSPLAVRVSDENELWMMKMM